MLGRVVLPSQLPPRPTRTARAQGCPFDERPPEHPLRALPSAELWGGLHRDPGIAAKKRRRDAERTERDAVRQIIRQQFAEALTDNSERSAA
jgi:hypothetical protein